MKLPSLILLCLAVPLLSSCFFMDGRTGVGLAPAFVYKNVTTPMSAGPRGGPGLVINGPIKSYSVTAHRIGLDIPFVFPPGVGDALSVGWGNMSLERALREGEIDSFLFADGNEMTILGLYTRNRIIVYSEVREESEVVAAPGQ